MQRRFGSPRRWEGSYMKWTIPWVGRSLMCARRSNVSSHSQPFKMVAGLSQKATPATRRFVTFSNTPRQGTHALRTCLNFRGFQPLYSPWSSLILSAVLCPFLGRQSYAEKDTR